MHVTHFKKATYQQKMCLEPQNQTCNKNASETLDKENQQIDRRIKQTQREMAKVATSEHLEQW